MTAALAAPTGPTAVAEPVRSVAAWPAAARVPAAIAVRRSVHRFWVHRTILPDRDDFRRGNASRVRARGD
jgi:hypothetical protein